jgi:P27 family predicted phage terminase small subunit
MRGLTPIPDVVKIAKGTFRKQRKKHTPPPRGNIPECPFTPGSLAAEKWAEVVEGLQHFKLIDKIDSTHIEGLCIAYERAKKADAQVEKEGPVILGCRDTAVKHPAIQISIDSWRLVRSYGNDLGLNHLSRQRMQARDTAEDNNGLESKYLG